MEAARSYSNNAEFVLFPRECKTKYGDKRSLTLQELDKIQTEYSLSNEEMCRMFLNKKMV